MDNLSEINCRVSDPLKIIEDNYFKTWIEKYMCGSRWVTVTWIIVALVFWKLKLRNKNSALICHFSSAKCAIMGSGRIFVGNFCRQESSRKCFGGEAGGSVILILYSGAVLGSHLHCPPCYRDAASVRGISSALISLGKSDYASCLGSRQGSGVLEAWGLFT